MAENKKNKTGLISGILRRSRTAGEREKSGQERLEDVLRGHSACGHLLGAVSEAVIATDEELVVMGWNHAAETIYGWTAEEVLGKKLGVLLATRMPDNSSWESKLPQIIEQGSWQGEVTQRKRGGGKLDIFTSIKALQNKNGDTVIISVNRDLTAQHQLEDNFRWSEEQFQTLADAIPQFVWITDERGEISWCNRRWVEYTGITLEETHNNGWQKAHHPDYLPCVMERITKAFREGKLWEDVFPLKNKNGQYRMFFTRSVPFRDNKGKPSRWLGTNTDINEIRDAQQALKESEKRYRYLVDNTGDGYILFENVLNFVGTLSDLRYSEVNAAFERITGELRDEVIGNTVSKMFPADNDIFLRHLNQVMETGEPQHFEWHSKALEKNFTADAFAVRPGYTAVLFREAVEDDDEEIEK